jgi:prepilin-type N-terminal cleavage/methylation domain-containing protein
MTEDVILRFATPIVSEEDRSVLPGSHHFETQNGKLQGAKLHAAFSLIELLVVISIIAVVAGLITFAVSRALSEQKSKQCLTNMMMIEAAKDEYLRDHIGENMPSPNNTDFVVEFRKYFRFGIPRCPDNPSSDYVNWNDLNQTISCTKHSENNSQLAPRVAKQNSDNP